MAVCLAAIVASPLAATIDTGQTRLFKYLMGTSMRVEVYGSDEAARRQAADEAFAAIAEVDRLMSDYRDDSELTSVNNAAASRAVPVSAPLFAVLEAAERVSRQSDGAFDVAVRPLTALWGFKTHQMHVPTASELNAIRPLIGYRNVTLDRDAHTVRFNRDGVQLDLGGIAKGFAAEVAAGSLKRRGLAGMIDAGGNQYMVGLPSGKPSWSVGISDPDRRGALLGAIDIQGGAVSTASGAATREPLLDPRTLQPSTASLSATVVSEDGTLADALSKAVFVLGPTRGLALLNGFTNAWGVVAYRQPDGSIGIAVSRGHLPSFHPSAAH
jgi:FAD:protein FMN transferase